MLSPIFNMNKSRVERHVRDVTSMRCTLKALATQNRP